MALKNWFGRKPTNPLDRPDARGVAELIIHGVLETLPEGEQAVREYLQTWIDANNLHPENVQSIDAESLDEAIDKAMEK